MSAHENQYELFDKDMPLMDAPAFVRRAREVEDAWTALKENCVRERARLLEMPRMRLARLFALAQSSIPLTSAFNSAEDVEPLRRLHDEWQPRLRARVAPAHSLDELARAAADLRRSFERFNRRWLKTLREIDLARINRLRENYNRFYLLEKECALRSTRMAREGFQPLAMVTVDDLLAELPLLVVPRVEISQ